MRKATWLFVLFVFGLLLIPGIARAQDGSGRDPQEEQRILDRLAALNPQAVPVFQQASQALDANQYQAAAVGFTRVLELAPNSADAERRLAVAVAGLGQPDQAVLHARRAVSLDPSPVNRGWLALILLQLNRPSANVEAVQLAQQAVGADPEDETANGALLFAAGRTNDPEDVRRASANLVRYAPQNPYGHMGAALVAASDRQWLKAESELQQAQALGLSADYIAKIRTAAGIGFWIGLYQFGERAAYTIAVWLAGLGLLFLVGTVLSRLTLASVHRMVDHQTFDVHGPERLLRGVYSLVIGISAAYFYISIPILLFIVVVLTGGLIYLMFVVRVIPIRFALLLLLFGLYTLWAVMRSVFTRVRQGEPGRRLRREEAPRLWAVVEQVAARLSTRPVDVIYVNPGTGVGVSEQGGILQKLRGRGQRRLVLGLGALPGLTQGQFEAVLAHEYGHLSNRDTAGGLLVVQVSASIQHMAMGLAMRGLAGWTNPVWWFVNGYYRIFLRITLGASRLREILADRYAVLAYGLDNFTNGLRQIVSQSVRFNSQVQQALQSALDEYQNTQHFQVVNLYTLPDLATGDDQVKVEEALQSELTRPTSPYDSHPGFQERIDLARRIPNAPLAAGAPGLVWDLFDDPAALQAEMTGQIEAQVRSQLPPPGQLPPKPAAVTSAPPDPSEAPPSAPA